MSVPSPDFVCISKRRNSKTNILILFSFLFAHSLYAQKIKSAVMKKEIIKTEKAPSPIGPYSQAVAYGNLLFVSGQIAINPETGTLVTGSITAETQQVMKNIQSILNAAGLNMEHILKTTIFLKSMDDFAAVNEVYGSYFTGNYPARETVQVSRLPKDVNVEISVIAGL
jgi:2-iminobutanoate/2-iminopropanoate deaminase